MLLNLRVGTSEQSKTHNSHHSGVCVVSVRLYFSHTIFGPTLCPQRLLKADGNPVVIIGTAHAGVESAKAVEHVLRHVQPDAVAVVSFPLSSPPSFTCPSPRSPLSLPPPPYFPLI
jgi:hypothetical protein